MRKIVCCLFSLLMLAAVAGSFSGCGDTGAADTTLTVWSAAPLRPNYESELSRDETNKQALFTKKLVETFETQNPGYTVQLIDSGWGDSLMQNLTWAVQGNSLPDILIGEVYVPTYIDMGIVQEIELGELEDKIVESAIAPAVQDGKYYGVPFATGCAALFINTEVLKNAGILEQDGTVAAEYEEYSPLAPQTWEDLEYLAKAVDESEYYSQPSRLSTYGGILLSGANGISSAFRAMPLMRTAGGDFLVDGENVFDSNANVKAFEQLRRLYQYAPQNSYTLQDDRRLSNFSNGRAAYAIEGADALSLMGEGVVTAPLPTYEGSDLHSNILMGNAIFSITTACTKKDIAINFLELILSEDIQRELYDVDNRVPVNKDVLESEELAETDNYALMKPYLDAFKSEESFGGLPCYVSNTTTLWTQWNAFMQKVLTTSENIDGLVKDYSDAIDTLNKIS